LVCASPALRKARNGAGQESQGGETATSNQISHPAADWVPDCKGEPWLTCRLNGNVTCHWIVIQSPEMSDHLKHLERRRQPR
jgi:hypothetical protein